MRARLLLGVGLFMLPVAACSSNDDGNGGGGGGKPFEGPAAWNRQVTPPSDDEASAQRLACGYARGSLPAETQGASHPSGKDIPVDHVLILMQENRSFDHYFSKLPESGQPDVEVTPADYTNPDAEGNPVAPFHDTTYCFVDTNHEWAGSHEQYDDGKMDGFFASNDDWGSPPAHPLADSNSGKRALGYYDQTDLPFYYWMANEYSIADHYFAALLGPTWPNREFLYGASSRGATKNTLVSFLDQAGACTTDADCGLDAPEGSCEKSGGMCKPVGRTIFDYMEQRKIDWRVYSANTPGFALAIDVFLEYGDTHLFNIDQYFVDAAAGNLPQVAFIDPHIGAEAYFQDDEHPPATPFPGQLFVANVVDALQKSPEWSSSALFVTYDEHGGLFDHVAPPKACPPGDFPANVDPGDPTGDFDRYGVRVPMMLVSPFAKKHYVAHEVYDHTSILRFVESRFVLPALTGRDANALAPWEMFDFAGAPHATPPSLTLPDGRQDAIDACKSVFEE